MDVSESESLHQDAADVEETAHEDLLDFSCGHANVSHIANVTNSIIDIEQLVNQACKEMEISEEDQRKLAELHINITWEVPYIHTLERKKNLDLETIAHIRQHLAEKGLQLLVKERYTPEENRIIKKNWEEFSEVYGFDNPTLFFRSHIAKCMNKMEKYKFKLFLAKNIHTRLLQSVQNRFEELYGTLKRGRFSQNEDSVLLSLMKYDLSGYNVPKLKLICKILGRSQMSVTIRLKKILKYSVKNPEQVSQKMKSYEVDSHRQDLIKILLKIATQNLNIKNYKDLEHTPLSDTVFDKVGCEVGIEAVRVKRYWLDPLYAQLFAKRTLSRNRIRADMINLLSNPPYDAMMWEDVPWNEVSEKLGNIGPFFTYRRVFEMVRRYVPYGKRKNFKKCLQHLKRHYLQALTMNRIKDVIMPKIRYSSKTDEVIVIEEEERRDEDDVSLELNESVTLRSHKQLSNINRKPDSGKKDISVRKRISKSKENKQKLARTIDTEEHNEKVSRSVNRKLPKHGNMRQAKDFENKREEKIADSEEKDNKSCNVKPAMKIIRKNPQKQRSYETVKTNRKREVSSSVEVPNKKKKTCSEQRQPQMQEDVLNASFNLFGYNTDCGLSDSLSQAIRATPLNSIRNKAQGAGPLSKETPPSKYLASVMNIFSGSTEVDSDQSKKTVRGTADNVNKKSHVNQRVASIMRKGANSVKQVKVRKEKHQLKSADDKIGAVLSDVLHGHKSGQETPENIETIFRVHVKESYKNKLSGNSDTNLSDNDSY